MEFYCEKCGKNFYADFPYGDDVQCNHCLTWWETEMEEDYDNLFAWITNEAPGEKDRS
jgi:hypothetical protein